MRERMNEFSEGEELGSRHSLNLNLHSNRERERERGRVYYSKQISILLGTHSMTAK